MADDGVLTLAYDAALAALVQQETALKSIGNRATGLLSASTVGASLATAVGVLNIDPANGSVLGAWWGWALLMLVLLIGATSIAVVWPTSNWNFGPNPRKLLDHAGASIDDVRRDATDALAKAIDENEQLIKFRSMVYRTGALLLVAQSVVLVIGLLASR